MYLILCLLLLDWLGDVCGCCILCLVLGGG